MEFFTARGRFWLPREHDRVAVAGAVSFQEDGVRLELEGSLRPQERRPGDGAFGAPAELIEPVIHGFLRDGREVTLLAARGFSWHAYDIGEDWRAEFLLCGGHFQDDNFVEAQVCFDYLSPWARPDAVVTRKPGEDRVVIDTEDTVVDTASFDSRAKIKLCTGVEGRSSEGSVHLDQWAAFEITGSSRKRRTVKDVLDGWVRPLQDLLVFSVGRPVRIDHIAVSPRRRDTKRKALAEVYCQLIQPPSGRRPTASDLLSYTSPALLTYRDSPVPFERLIPAWFELHQRLADVITDLCGPYYAPFIYSGHRYASTFQSAEGLANNLLSAKQKTRPEHKARVKRVMDALAKANLEQADLDWAAPILDQRNDKKLTELVEELILGAGEIGTMLLDAVPQLPQEAATARARVSHPGQGGPNVYHRYWIGEALTWVVRVLVLAQLSVPLDSLSRQASQKASFQEVLTRLKAGGAPPRPSKFPSYHHGSCSVNHRTRQAAERCRNR